MTDIKHSKPIKITKIKSYKKKNDGITFYMKTEVDGLDVVFDINVISSNILRFKLVRDGKKDLKISLLTKYFRIPQQFEIKDNLNEIVMECERWTIKIIKNPFNFKIYDSKERLILETNDSDAPILNEFDFRPLGFSCKEDKSIVATHCEFTLQPDEHFFGLGEKFLNLDKRGQDIKMWNSEALGVRTEKTYKNVPFFMSTRRYGIFVDSTFEVNFRLGSESTATFSIINPTDELDFYVIINSKFKDILNEYTELTGKPPVPPKWSFGIWMSTGFMPVTQEEVIRIAKEIRKRRLPVDVLHIDPYWMSDLHWTDFTWDKEAFPDPEAMINTLHKMGFKLCLWINPYVIHVSPIFEELEKEGYFLKKEDESTYLYDAWLKLKPPCGIIDMTNPKAIAWFKSNLKKLLDMGVDTFKVDFGEEIPGDAYFHNGKTGKEMHNLYSLLYAKIVFETIQKVKGKQAIIWCRSGTAGSQKYPIHWSGDPHATYTGMTSTLRGGLSLLMSGFSFWSSDIGGFYGKSTKDLFVRWTQFGIFSSHCRFHGTSTRYPWDYGKEAEEIVKKYMELRYELLPYIYTYAHEAHEFGIPIMRPMMLEFQEDPNCWFAELQYMFGQELLIAPIFNNTGERCIYLPRGRWIDYWTKKVYYGERNIFVKKGLDQMPIFVKENSIIPKTDKSDYIENNPLQKLILEVFLKDKASFTLKDDYEEIKFIVSRRGNRIEIQATKSTKEYIVRLITVDSFPRVCKMTINGKTIEPVTQSLTVIDKNILEIKAVTKEEQLEIILEFEK